MSEEILTGTAGKEAAQGFEPMVTASTPPEDDKETYGSEESEIRRAAKDLTERRASSESPLIDRGYVHLQGEKAGEPVEPNLTLRIEQAAKDLKRVRDAEVLAQTDAQAQQLANVVDELKRPTYELERAKDALADYQAANGIDPNAPQSEQQPAINGLHPDVAAALQNPNVRAAINAEVQQAEVARHAYAVATQEQAKLALASIFAGVPALQGLEGQALVGAIQLLERTNPQQAAVIRDQLRNVDALMQASNRAAQQQQNLAARQMHAWTISENARFQAWADSSPDNQTRVKTIQGEALKLMESEYGVTPQQLAALYQFQPLLRSAIGSRIILDALSYAAAKRSAMQATPKPPVPTQRPGTAGTYVRDRR